MNEVCQELLHQKEVCKNLGVEVINVRDWTSGYGEDISGLKGSFNASASMFDSINDVLDQLKGKSNMGRGFKDQMSKIAD